MSRLSTLAFLLVSIILLMSRIAEAQKLNISSPQDFKQCVAQDVFMLTIENKSDQAAIDPNSYRIDWGDGVVDENVAFTSSLTHTYRSMGVFTLTFTARAKGASSNLPPIIRTVINEIAQPAIGIKIAAGGIQCVGSTIDFEALNWESNSPYTSYIIDFADGVQATYTGEELEKMGGHISHLYTKSHCQLNQSNGISIRITADNGCAVRSANIENIYIVLPTKISFDLPAEECTGNQITPLNTSSPDGDDACRKPTYSWLVDGEVPDRLPLIFNDPGTYEITLNATKGAECSKATLTKNITVIRRVEAVVEPVSTEICEGATVALKGSGSAGDKKTYNWKVIKGRAADVVFSPGNDVADPQVTFKKHGSYQLQLVVDNGCSTDNGIVDVIVKKDPEVIDFRPLGAICPEKVLSLGNYITYDWTWEGNPQKATWTLEGPVKGDEFLLGSDHSLYPQLRFTNPGEYTLHVALDGVGCGDGSKLEASQNITVYDPAISGDITYTPALDVCENTDIVFTNDMKGVNLMTTWAVLKNGVAVDPSEYIRTPGNGGKTQTFRFNTYGDYTIVAALTAECDQDKKEFTVKVRRAPEVYFTTFPSIICPGIPFLPGEYIDLRPNGNEGKITYSWAVTGNADQVELEGANTSNPKIVFLTHGEFTLTLTINNPTSCISPSTTILTVVKVSNPQMDLDIAPDKTVVCVGDRITLKNNSVVGVEPGYYWGVSPEGYRFTQDQGEKLENPTIEFLKSGIYNITGVISGACRPETRAFTIIVQQDPEVELDSIFPVCPGSLTLAEDVVHYTWNDNWKTGAEATRRAVWKLVSKPANADCTPPESIEWNALYPKLYFNTPGEYILKVEAKSDALCNGSKLSALRRVTVHDPSIQVDIKPQLTADVIELVSGSKFQVVEGSPLVFTNNSRGVGLSYSWTVSPGADVAISDAQAGEPALTFRKYGIYNIRVDLTGTCSSAFREFTVVVKGIPKFDLRPLPNRCDTWEEIDLRDYLACDSSGSTNIICNWEIKPASGFVLTKGTTSDMFYKVKFNKAGKYELILKAQAEYGGEQTVSQTINILRSVVTAKAELSGSEGCTTDGLKVVALNKSDGDSLTYTWKVVPEDGYSAVATPEKWVADVINPGDYQVMLKAENICGTDEQVYSVHAYARPEVAMLGDSDLGRVCEKGYSFSGEQHVGEIKENNDPLTFVRWRVSPEGVSWKNLTDSTDWRPDMEFEGGKNYVITGMFKNRCKDTVKVHYTLAVDEFVPVELMPDTTVCAHTEPFLLHAKPHGGEWTCSDVTVLEERTDKNYYFNPYRDDHGKFGMVYTRGNGECRASGEMQVTVNKLPVVDAGDDLTSCLNSDPIALTGVIPANGEWRGNSVREGSFYPGESGEGQFRLEYWFTDNVTGCPNRDTIKMTVYPLPDASFNVSWQQCQLTDSLYVPVELGVGNHFSWDFGNGDTRETEDAPAVYQYAATGTYSVVLKATSVHHCTVVSDPQQVIVLGLPPAAAFTLADTAGCGEFTAYPVVNPADFAGENLNLKYFWDFGNGNTSTLQQPEAQPYQATLFDTTYHMVFKVYNACGTELDTAKIGVWSKAVANFAMNPEEEGCTPAEVLFMNKSTGSHNSYTWNFDDGELSEEIDPTHVFMTNNSMSVFQIKLTATNRCTPEASFFERILKVKPNTIVAGFTKSKKYLCAGDTVFFENNSVDRDPAAALNYSWDFGDGQVAAVWDTCHEYRMPGVYYIVLKIDNGCAHRQFKDSVIVHVLPELHLEGQGPLCEDLELKLKLSSEEPLKNINWDFGDGTTGEKGAFEVKHTFQEPGIYQVKVRGEGNQIPSCPGEAIRMIEVWPNPRVKILPLDTMACPPLLYRPELVATSYDYFTWDYGDGTPVTSEMEHLYINDTNFIQAHHITAYVENNYGCKEEHHGLIRLYNKPKAAWDKSITYGRPEKVRFINLSRDYTEAIWYLPFGEVVNSPEDQVVVFNDEGVYPMSLAVANSYGCRDSIYQEYRSYEGGLYFPNSFIPHSTNPKVNNFRGVGMGLKTYKLEMFDLYGNKIWETTALDGGMPAEGWDGRNKNGELLPQGMYMWRAEAIFFSEDVWTGQNNRSGKRQTTQGSVLLLRK